FVLSQGSNYSTYSAFVNDRWTLTDKWTFNLGVRWDKNDAVGGDGHTQIADDAAFSPRLALHYDTFANGRLVFNASYGTYVGRLAEGAINDADPAGRSASLQWDYRGPSINNDVNVPTGQLIPTDRAIQMVMDWFFANGGTNRRPFRTTPSVPGVETILDLDGLPAPMVKEYTVGVGSVIGTRGFVRADVIRRNWDNFYTSYRNQTTGKVSDQFGTQYDLSILRADNEVYDREYTAVQTQANYRPFKPLQLGLTYTWSRLVGNVTGEDSGSGPLVGVAGEYPEYRGADWNYPMGYLSGDQRHRAKFWASYDIPTRVGNFNVTALQNFDSGTATSVDGSIDPRPFVTGTNYLTPPASISYFFGGRGTLKTDNVTRTDLALNYSVKLARGFTLFVEPEVINLFNEDAVTSFDEEVLTNIDCPGGTAAQAPGCPTGGLAAFNPFTTQPVEGTNFLRGQNFGKPDSEGDFQQPRTFRVSVGLRF
ncbi:MAG TPA: TonB-dependent receptor, partial [Thermoanaerobaculia bacterium]